MKEKNAEKLCMFQKSCTFAPSKQKDDNRSLILGYGVMVTQQILVLFFLVRVRVAQQKGVLSNQNTFLLFLLFLILLGECS